MTDQWTEIRPEVSAEAEFFEIANDFGNPLEVLREAISNSMDAGATSVRIAFLVEDIEGASTLVVEIHDNGSGMDQEVLAQDFWGLGFSRSRNSPEKIGEKGHGTKIFLRSERVLVRTQSKTGAFESVCERPLRSLTRRQLHSPKVRRIENFQDATGTHIRIEGYNQNERSGFVQDIVKDYLLWFSKIGSVERAFGVEKWGQFKVHLKCLDVDEFEEVPFGHVFPEENSNVTKLFEQYGVEAADLFVKRYVHQGRLQNLPEITFEAIISVEGDQAKRDYNPMIRERARKTTGTYKVADRYGIWLCKDHIPVQRVNEWITGFGTGSNSFVLLHGFVNCQKLKLTANRGSVANTEPKVVEELKRTIQQMLETVDKDLHRNGIHTLFQWQSEQRTLSQEKAEFERRTRSIAERKLARLDGRVLLEPVNEAELFGLFNGVYTRHPEVFDFEPLDYNTQRGIDIIARNKTENRVSECEFWYIEMKYLLREEFNHAFRHLRWIVCWDFDRNVKNGTSLKSIEEADVRQLTFGKDSFGHPIYFLDSPKAALKIQVIRLKEFLKNKLNLDFAPET